MQTSRRTCSRRRLTWSSARSRWASEPGLVHAGVDEHDPVARRDRPGVAVRDAGPRQRQAQAPDARRARARPGRPRACVGRQACASTLECGTMAVAGRLPPPSAEVVRRVLRRADRRDVERAAALLRAGRRRRPARPHAGRCRRPRRRAFFAEVVRRLPRLRLRGARPRRPGRPRAPCAGRPTARSPGRALPGHRAQRRARRDRGRRRAAGPRRADRRATTPTSTASTWRARSARSPAAGLGGRAADDAAVQRAHPAGAGCIASRRPSRSPTASGSCAAASRRRR